MPCSGCVLRAPCELFVAIVEQARPVLVKPKADWLALTEAGVRQREIPVMRAQQLFHSGYDVEMRKPGANEFAGLSFCCSGA